MSEESNVPLSELRVVVHVVMPVATGLEKVMVTGTTVLKVTIVVAVSFTNSVKVDVAMMTGILYGVGKIWFGC